MKLENNLVFSFKNVYNKFVIYMKDVLKKCNLCKRNCLVNRYTSTGFCKQTNEIRIAKACLTYFEEPCISNTKGSGTIFFSGCNMGCCFCQNEKISTGNFGKIISIERLADIMLELESKGAININLVTPTPHIIGLIESIKIAKSKGLSIPIIYNTSSYENINSLKLLDGLIDVYLPDLKYFNDTYAIKYSKSPNYFLVATKNIEEMYRQVGICKFDSNGNIKKGVIVRHLMLPTLKEDTKKVLDYLYSTYHDNIYLSIMNQYTVIDNLKYKELNQKVKNKDYDEVIEYAINLGLKNCFCQLDDTSNTKYIPDFNLEGV